MNIRGRNCTCSLFYTVISLLTCFKSTIKPQNSGSELRILTLTLEAHVRDELQLNVENIPYRSLKN